jgi:glucosamine-6-phosphate deaminase
MRIFIEKDYDAMSRKAFEVIKEVIVNNPNAVLGLATGSSPIGMYQEMVKDHKENGTSYKNIKSVNLDEYVGLGEGDEQSYVTFMRENLFNHVDIDLSNTRLPNGKADDLQKECDNYNAYLDSLKVDVQVLGIGSNGHIGFNEPNTPFGSVTHIVDLTENTIKDNSRLFNSIDEVPKQALSMGIKNIMQAKLLLLVASGKNKADAIYKTVKGDVCETVPASVLQLHNNVVIICDEDAASLIK